MIFKKGISYDIDINGDDDTDGSEEKPPKT